MDTTERLNNTTRAQILIFLKMVFSISAVYNFFLITNVSTNPWLALDQSSRALKGIGVKGNACCQGKVATDVWMTHSQAFPVSRQRQVWDRRQSKGMSIGERTDLPLSSPSGSAFALIKPSGN